MEAEGLLGLPLPVTVAFVALLFGLALVARQLHKLHKPAIVRRSGGNPAAHVAPNRTTFH